MAELIPLCCPYCCPYCGEDVDLDIDEAAEAVSRTCRIVPFVVSRGRWK